MRIARCRSARGTEWAIVADDGATVTPLKGDIADISAALIDDFDRARLTIAGDPISLEDVDLLPPVDRLAHVVAAGATYARHVDGLGLEMPASPAAFYKPWTTLVGPQEPIEYPAITSALDYEVELVVVAGAPVRSASRPVDAVLGYCVGNDVSARDLQFRGSVTGMDMFGAKALDRTSPIGPWIVTRDEFGDEHPDLAMTCSVDGELRQSDRTSSMAWGADELFAFVDRHMRLGAGDVLFTGTPAGVGHETERYLAPGHEVETHIERLGTLRNVVADATD